jgi:hypothetical protein
MNFIIEETRVDNIHDETVGQEGLNELKTQGLFKGRAETKKKKTDFLKAYPEHDYMMKKAAYALGIMPGTVTSWYLSDQDFKNAYLELKSKKTNPKKDFNTELLPDEIAKIKNQFLALYDQKKMRLPECCDELKVTVKLVRHWLSVDPDFRNTYQIIVNKKRGFMDEDGNFNYDIIDKAHESIEAARIERQSQFLKSYVATTFNITKACKATNIQRATFKLWIKKYPEFKESFEDAFETKKDFIEGKLLENINANDSACIIHASKTLLKDRGYGEKQEIELTGNFGVMVVPGTAQDAEAWSAKAAVQQQELKRLTSEK